MIDATCAALLCYTKIGNARWILYVTRVKPFEARFGQPRARAYLGLTQFNHLLKFACSKRCGFGRELPELATDLLTTFSVWI